MKWFRKHVKHGSQLALFAMLVQFALSFGHFHPSAAQAAPASETRLTQSGLDYTSSAAELDETGGATRKSQPSDHDDDHPPATPCAICVVIALAASGLSATPPAVLLPQATQLRRPITDAEFAHLGSAHPPFQSRAPPRS